jgi:hypothetical protein
MSRISQVALVLVSAIAAAAGLAHCGSSPSTTAEREGVPPSALLGYVPAGDRHALVRVDAHTLRALGPRVDVGTEGCASRAGGTACWSSAPWSFSPDRSQLVVARNDEGAARSLRVVDIARMRATADIELGGGAVGLVAWPSRGRLLAIQELCCDELERLLVVDAARHRVIAHRDLGGTVVRVARSPRELVLLIAPARRVGVARVAVVDDRGGVRFVALERTPAGQQLLESASHRLRQSLPGLAVDPSGRRALVVGPGLVADVDLAGLAVSYHDLAHPISLLGRLREWLEPTAYAKAASGPVRTARWLGGGILAVTGSDEEPSDQSGRDAGARVRPAGLSLVDIRNWSVRTIDRGATDVRVAGDLLLATGSGSEPPGDAIGLTAYELDGTRRFQRFAGRRAWVEQVHDARAYVDVFRPGAATESLQVVDLATGRATRARAATPPRLLLGSAASWWDDP